MCSLYWQMENDQGDLSDILRASVPTAATTSGYDWSFPAETMNFPSRIGGQIENFGDLFCGGARDPLLHESEIPNSMFFPGSNALLLKKDNTSFLDSGHGDSIMMGQEIKPSKLLTRMLQIGPKPKIPSPAINSSPSSLSPRSIKPLSGDLKVKSIGEPNENGGVQMNSPRNPGIKRRKNQTKKVVCIPAPAAANSRSTGEVVPSDLWAWRKYGQKPIKGSPYPRGYYRCSSSKGCSARKQVERSRTDPNMLVITYTSEHNHPWPTQRNALAGSTRNPASKAAAASKVSLPPADHTPYASVEPVKEEDMFRDNDDQNESVVGVKEEIGDVEKSLENIDDSEMSSHDFQQSYRPLPPDSGQTDDFFSELGELEPDPLSLIFPHGFSGEKSSAESENKGLDSFDFFDWSDNHSSFSEPRRGL